MIAIIAAMEEEITHLRTMLENAREHPLDCVPAVRGSLCGQEVILLLSGIGKVNAAMSTSLVLTHLKPRMVINSGTAGGIDPRLTMGDMLISTAVCHHDVDAQAFGYARGQVPREPAFFHADPQLIAQAQKAGTQLQTSAKLYEGLIASGDQFINDHTKVEELRQYFPGIQAIEMEAAAIAQVCHRFATPFVITRAISDVADKESHLSFAEYLPLAARNSAALVMAMLAQM